MKFDSYKKAGVDIEAASQTKKNIRDMVRSTFGPEVLTDIGSFGGLFRPDFSGYKDPVLVSSADGVGTKLKVASMAGRHNTVGADLVNHCCNDILVMGAKPLFFLDYLAYAKHNDALVQAVVQGIAEGCRENRCALVGGEMAEMPDVYPEGEYDLAGVIVGMVDSGLILNGSRVRKGDVILGLASTGLHTNGYSLARKLIFETAGLKPLDILPGTGKTVVDALLAVHRSYGPAILPLLSGNDIHAMAHITGGGFQGNINRILPSGINAIIKLGSWEIPGLFRFLCKTGGLTVQESHRTFNMGIGMVVITGKDKAAEISENLRTKGETVFEIGITEGGTQEVILAE